MRSFFYRINLKLFIYILVLFSVQITAQKEIYKEIFYQNQEIDIQLLDVDLVEVMHTDEQKIAITVQDYAENPTLLKIEENKRIITITTSLTAPFQSQVKTEKYCYVQPLYPTFKIMIPKGCTITITYNKGNFKAINFDGNLNLSLDIGDVKIDNFIGKVNTEMLSGNMSVTIVNTTIDVQSNTGKIQTNFPTTNWIKTETSLKGVSGKNTNTLKVLSINANITLNSATTQ